MLKSVTTIIISLLISVSCFAQVANLSFGANDYKLSYTIAGLDQFAVVKPLGSPYTTTVFFPAKVEGIVGETNMRYNAYLDLIEFISTKNDTLILDKIPAFNTITFLGFNKKYRLVTYNNNLGKSHQGYLIELYQKKNYVLYKREWISLYAGKKAKTSLEKDMPAKFIKQDDSYYLKDAKGNITDFPESKKQLVKLFPDKKDTIETFVKESKVTFNDGAGRIQIIDFLASL